MKKSSGYPTSDIVLFLNGQTPNVLPNLSQYQKVFCTDGAYNYLKDKNIKPDLVAGDFDSYNIGEIPIEIEAIETPDQNYTDFEKILQIIIERGYKTLDVFGSSGKEHDHYLGNLSTALKYIDEISIQFYDDHSNYFFADKQTIIENFQGHIISLYPFAEAKNITTQGLLYPLNGEDLDLKNRIGLRNVAIENSVSIQFEEGNLLIFIRRDKNITNN